MREREKRDKLLMIGMNCLVDEIIIDVLIVWCKDYWFYLDMFWIEGLVLRFC